MSLPSRKGTLGFGIIGGFKLATGLLLAATGFGIFRLVNKDLADVLEHFAMRIHLDPENRLVQDAVSRVSGIDKAHLKALGVGTFFYAALETVEGVGLILRRHWAEYLTVIATGLLLPLEIYEIVEKMSALRIVVLLINLAILIYLIIKIRQKPRDRTGESPVPDAAGARS